MKMSFEIKNTTQRYLGEKGQEYFRLGFSKETEIGRLFQCRYFCPYCSKEKVLLDVGSADGFFLRNLPAKQRLGVEVNPKAIEFCQEQCEKQGIPISIYENLGEVPDACVDVVMSNHCLEHIPDPFEVLKQIRRVLKPEGVFVLVVPFDDWRQRDHHRWHPNDLNQHLYTWSPLNLGNLVTEAGFEVQDLDLKTSTWTPRLNWIHKVFGMKAYGLICRIFSFMVNRREVFCRAIPKQSQSISE